MGVARGVLAGELLSRRRLAGEEVGDGEVAAEAVLLALQAFAVTLRRDEAAARNALQEVWSQGQTEGQITRLKLIRRQMYGRGKLDLLSRRVLVAA